MSTTYSIADDTELKTRVRAATGYEDTADELPESQLSSIIETAKLQLSMEVDGDNFYANDGLSLALFAYTCMRAKSALENVALSSYSIGDEQVSFDTDDPDNSVQLQLWADDVATGIATYESATDDARVPTNTASYIGESSVRER